MNASRCQYLNDCANTLPLTGHDVFWIALTGAILLTAGIVLLGMAKVVGPR